MMKWLTGILFFVTSLAVADHTASTYKRLDDHYKLFTFSGAFMMHSNEDFALVYESPYGHIYDGGIWQHEENLTVDLRHIAVDFLGLKNVPVMFGMSYKTFPRDPYASSFQINRVETSIITPKIYGFVAEYEVHALSNSGRQGAATYLRGYYQNSFGLIDDPRINLISLMFSYIQTNGLGWIARTPAARGLDYTKMDWGQMFGTGLFWSPSKGYMGDMTIDLRAVDKDAFTASYLSYRVEHFWNDDGTQPAQVGKNNWRHSLMYGNSFDFNKDLMIQVEGGPEMLDDIVTFRAKAIVTLQTNFN